MAILEERHLVRLIRKSGISELFHQSHHTSVVDERLIHFLALSIGAEGEALRLAVVTVASTQTEP